MTDEWVNANNNGMRRRTVQSQTPGPAATAVRDGKLRRRWE
jgi:hypothetical protein